MKSIKKTARGVFGDHAFRDHVTKLLQAYEQFIMSVTIRDAFRKARLAPEFILTRRPLRFSEHV
jgi:hypothetical protein